MVFNNASIRQTIHVSVGADYLRLRISNAFGITDLPITAVTVALPVDGAAGVSAIQTRTLKTVTFSGDKSIIVPNGGLIVSDPIDFTVKPESILAVTIYLANGQQSNAITSHPGSRTVSFFTPGNAVNAADFTDPATASAAHWSVGFTGFGVG